jgi:hypothetical protein
MEDASGNELNARVTIAPDDWEALSDPRYPLASLDMISGRSSTLENSVVVLANDEPVAMVPLAISDRVAISHPSMFAGGIFSGKICTTKPDLVRRIVEETLSVLASRGDTDELQVRLKPTYACPGHECEAGAWSNLPGSELTQRTAWVIQRDEHGEWPQVSSRRRRALRKSVATGVVVSRVATLSQQQKAFAMLSDFYASRGLPFWLTRERLRELVEHDHEDVQFVGAFADTEMLGVAFWYRWGEAVRMPVYATMTSANALGATDALINYVKSAAKAIDVGHMDLGVSDDPVTGQVVPGIVEFKRQLGAEPHNIVTARIPINSGFRSPVRV